MNKLYFLNLNDLITRKKKHLTKPYFENIQTQDKKYIRLQKNNILNNFSIYNFDKFKEKWLKQLIVLYLQSLLLELLKIILSFNEC